MMKQSSARVGALAVLAGAVSVGAAGAVVSMDWVSVGDAGNASDGTGYGAVAYEYQIARNEVTVGQYCEFLNAVAQADPYSLYDTNMGTVSTIAGISRSGSAGSYSYSVLGGTANKPITFVSWFDAARFCNWMHNGQGSGSTETGAYTLNGAMSGIYTVNSGAAIRLPAENEWYKAAYYDPTKGGSGGYWLHANQSDAMTSNTIGVAGAANFFDGDYVGYPGMALTDVGAYGANADSYYGTNDQGGNVWEWNDEVLSSTRGLRGGAWTGNEIYLRSSYRNNLSPELVDNHIGFRVVGVPEPTAYLLTLVGGGAMLARRRR